MCEKSHTVLRSDVHAAHKCFAYTSLPSQDVETCMGCLQDKNEMLFSVQVLAHKAGTCHTLTQSFSAFCKVSHMN
jgi:hypothetical protein